MRITSSIVALVIAASGCTDETAKAERNELAQQESAAPAGSHVVDSIFPMYVMIGQMQAEFPAVTGFGADAPASRDELIGRFAAAVADSSIASLSALTLNAAEFAHLYFPTSIYARVPYAQPPAVNWLLLEQNSLKGQTRLLRYYGGKPLAVEGYDCDAQPRIEGANRIWETCQLRIRTADGDVESVRLFGSIIGREGRFKFMSLANRL